MTIQLPSELQTVASWVLGENWPEGDEDALRRLSEAWTQASAAVAEVHSSGDAAMSSALSAIEGDTHDAMQRYWQGGQGVSPRLDGLAEGCMSLSQSCENAALEVEFAKLQIIAALVQLAVEVAIMIAAEVETLGASTAGIAAAEMTTREAVQLIYRALVQELRAIVERMLKGAAESALKEIGQEALDDATGQGSGFDPQKILKSAVQGGVQGGLDIGGGKDGEHEWTDSRAGRFGSGAQKAADGLGDLGDKLGDFSGRFGDEASSQADRAESQITGTAPAPRMSSASIGSPPEFDDWPPLDGEQQAGHHPNVRTHRR